MVTDLRTISFDVPPQEILTKDSVTVAVDAVVYYKINNPMKAVCGVADYAKSTKLLASTTLRNYLGTRNLSEILSERENIAQDMLAQLDTATDPWGIQVYSKFQETKFREIDLDSRFQDFLKSKYMQVKISKKIREIDSFHKFFCARQLSIFLPNMHRLNVLRLRMSAYHTNCKELWPPKLRPLVRPELK